MPGFYRLTFLPESRIQDFHESRGNYYRLNDGSEITLEGKPVWCDRCGKVTEGEVIESIEKIDERIANLERLAAEIRLEMTRPPPPDLKAPGDRFQREQILELELRREWRKRRQTPPRCILCGCTQIVPLEHAKPVRVGDISIVLEMVGMCSTGFNMWYFTPEGERIREMT